MIYLLDTNVASEPAKPQPDKNCMLWLQANKADCVISSVTLAELRYGVEKLEDGKHKAKCGRDFDYLAEDYRGRFFVFDEAAAAEWGRYAAQLLREFGADWWKTFDFRDTQIAAIAREYALTVVTRNEKHFPFCQTVNPFTTSA
jgi:hypothetical protein